jgi:hypothetical protein
VDALEQGCWCIGGGSIVVSRLCRVDVVDVGPNIARRPWSKCQRDMSQCLQRICSLAHKASFDDGISLDLIIVEARRFFQCAFRRC